MTETRPEVRLTDEVRPFVADLLQSRLDGKLTDSNVVVTIAARHQPPQGFSNANWVAVCDFILLLKDADNIPAAVKLANEYGLDLKL